MHPPQLEFMHYDMLLLGRPA